MSEIKITYETLFDLLRREKSREELQKLDPEFYKDVLAYLHEKQAILQDTSTQAELFASSEKEKIRIQFQNIKKILRELYERREKKILNLALTQSRTNSNLTDMGSLMEMEKTFFHELTALINVYKENTLNSLLNLNLPETPFIVRSSFGEVSHAMPLSSTEPLKENSASFQTAVSVASEQTLVSEQALSYGQSVSSGQILSSEHALSSGQTLSLTKSHLTLRFKSSVPKFLGTELEIYGPYQTDDTAELPCEIAQVLIQKGRAEEIK
ncbi:MAG: hypothetical protein AABX70_06290 [Nanoarchaeota archaeon]